MERSNSNSVSTPGLSRWENRDVDGYNNNSSSSSSNNKPSESVTKQNGYSMSSSLDPMMTGLRLGRRKEYGDNHHDGFHGISASAYPAGAPAGPAKRSRASYQSMQNPCCQVEGCNLDLKSAKDYHRRHRICESHSKSPRVIVSGMERRFCQQCSRFHDLSEFDDKKRSCRRRLSDHNARRRRVQPESVQLLSVGLTSALYDHRHHNLLLNGRPVPLLNSAWEDANTYALRQGLIRPSRTGGLEGTMCYSSDELRKSISELNIGLDKPCPIQSSNQRVLDQSLQIPTTGSPIVPDLLNAHSLLSSNLWSLNEGQSTSMDGCLVHGNYNSNNNNNQYMRKSNSEPQSLSDFQSYSIINPVAQGAAVTMVDDSVNAGISHQQEYPLLKAAAHDSTCFGSGRRNL